MTLIIPYGADREGDLDSYKLSKRSQCIGIDNSDNSTGDREIWIEICRSTDSVRVCINGCFNTVKCGYSEHTCVNSRI